jgi:uncharacterized membrane protein YhaH (DUF805 family)
MIEWYKKVVFDNYANFSGRARRSEYWYFILMQIIIMIVAGIIDNMIGLDFGTISNSPIYSLYILATTLPGFALAVRRMHDLGKSGWFLLVFLIPFIGGLWLLILLCSEGEQGTNQYGVDPKNPQDEIDEIGKVEA